MVLPGITAWDPNEPARLVLSSDSAEETAGLGEVLAGLLQAGDILCLDGDLGAGKTAFTRGIAAGLRCRGPVSSPTFTLLMEHPAGSGGLPLYHFDVYRLSGSEDFCEAGLDEYFEQDGVCVVEWGALIAEILPERTLTLHMYQADPGQPDLRRIEIGWPSEPGRLARLAEMITENRGDDAKC